MRIAVLGGTFDPIHNGHLAAARSVSSTFESTQFTLCRPTRHRTSKPHDSVSAFHRFAMVALAIAPFDEFRVSTMEVDAMEKRYTVDTLELMRSRSAGRIVFVLGTDMYQDFETWKDYQRAVSLAHLAVVHRPGFPFREDWRRIAFFERRTGYASCKAGVFYLPFVEQPISSTDDPRGMPARR